MRPPAGANGVIPVNVLPKQGPPSAPRHQKASAPRLKLICRRLPPGLTRAEFETILGEEWKLGTGRIDWMNYRVGKISKDIAKPSKPARAYIHVTQQAFAAPLGDRVREASFHDAAKTFQDNALVGPPVLEYAPYPKLPGGRRRIDSRQGTIDQDAEFKDFLESLTAPISKPVMPDAETQKPEKVKTTPLIEALREKKANKAKPHEKKPRGDSKEDGSGKKAVTKAAKEIVPVGRDVGRAMSRVEKEKAQKDAVKALNKEASALKSAVSSTSTEKSIPAAPAPERKRATVDLSKLQRDLGLASAPSRRRGTKREVTHSSQETLVRRDESTSSKTNAREAASTPTVANPAASNTSRKERSSRADRRGLKDNKPGATEKPASKDPDENAKPPAKAVAGTASRDSTVASSPALPATQKASALQSQQSVAPRGPASSRAPPNTGPQTRTAALPPIRAANPTSATSAQRALAATAATAPAGRQAFLKHANASQGITEHLIKEALGMFGTIDKVEIDARKGFCYVDFAEPEGLRKAIAASPINVAQGAVQVLERKDKSTRSRPLTGPPAPAARGRGGFAPRGGRSGRASSKAPGQAGPVTGASDVSHNPPASNAVSAASTSAVTVSAAPAIAAGGSSASGNTAT